MLILVIVILCIVGGIPIIVAWIVPTWKARLCRMHGHIPGPAVHPRAAYVVPSEGYRGVADRVVFSCSYCDRCGTFVERKEELSRYTIHELTLDSGSYGKLDREGIVWKDEL